MFAFAVWPKQTKNSIFAYARRIVLSSEDEIS